MAYKSSNENKRSFPWNIQSVRRTLNEIKAECGSKKTGRPPVSINPEMFALVSLRFDQKVWARLDGASEKS
mgnify:CR=1 FL=1